MRFDRRSKYVAKGRLAWISLAAIAALALAMGLTLTLTRFRALAQPASSASAESPTEPTAVVTSQIRSPNRDSHIVEKEAILISGIAWREGTDPPYITGDLFLSVERTTERAYLLTWSSLPSASFYLLEEATDPAFTDPVAIFFGEDTAHAHTQPGDGTFYYRVKADAAGVETSRWSNVISVTVPWVEASAAALSPAIDVNDSVTVEVRWGEPAEIDSSTWYTADTTETSWGWEWSYEWTPPEREDTQYLIQTRASEEGTAPGIPDTITITLDNQYFLVHFPLIFQNWPPRPVLNPIPAPSPSRSYPVTWQAVDADIDQYTLQQARTSDFSIVDGLWSTSQTSRQIQNAYCAYYYRVRADDASEWGEGPWSNVEQGQASPPDPPVLDDITDPNKDNIYDVTWSPVSLAVPGVAVDRYVLQESKDPTFTTINRQWSTNEASLSVTNGEYGTFYYRVRADDLDCWGPGPWSEVESIGTVWRYYDDFSNMNSGWPSLVDDERWAFYEVDPDPPVPGDGSPYPTDGHGYFIARRSGGEPLAAFSPGVTVPSDSYEIEVDSRWWASRWGATYQILFGANASLSDYYAVRVKIDDVINLCRFSLVKKTGSTTAVLSDGWIDTYEINCGQRRDDGSTPWNHWRIRRDGDRIRVDVNGTFLGEWSDSSFGANRYFGVRCTLYEGFTPSKPEFDNWSVRID